MPVRRVLLDSNLLIAVFDPEGTTDPERRAVAKARLADLLRDDGVSIAITPLIRYEELRGVPWYDAQRLSRVREGLDGIEELNITGEVSERAADLYRLDRMEHASDRAYNLDKRRFDAFHVAAAKVQGLEMASDDAHVVALLSLHDRL